MAGGGIRAIDPSMSVIGGGMSVIDRRRSAIDHEMLRCDAKEMGATR